jgi:hypothetical protein
MGHHVKSLDWDKSKLYQTHQPDPNQRRVTFKRDGIVVDLPLRNPTYSWLRNVLTLLWQINWSFRPEIVDGEITDLTPVFQSFVRKTEDAEDGALLVYLEDSARAFVLRQTAPGFLQLRDYLRSPQARLRPVMVDAGDDRVIREIVVDGVEDVEGRGPTIETCEVERSLLTKVWPNEADDLFVIAQGLTCPLPTASPECVPFLFPDDGCWVRAHAMSNRIRRERKVETGKAWIYGDLRVGTPNHPDCVVSWDFHVAPVVRVGDGSDDLLVIDPSVMGRAVPIAEWKATLGDAKACVQVTDASVYKQSKPCKGVTERCGQLERNLKFYQACLLARAKGLPSPPPYHCRPAWRP